MCVYIVCMVVCVRTRVCVCYKKMKYSLGMSLTTSIANAERHMDGGRGKEGGGGGQPKTVRSYK